MPGDSDEELARAGSGWGRRPPKPSADPYAIERDTERARPLDDERADLTVDERAGGADEEPSDGADEERARPTDEELSRAGDAGAISGPATSHEPTGIDPGEPPEARKD